MTDTAPDLPDGTETDKRTVGEWDRETARTTVVEDGCVWCKGTENHDTQIELDTGEWIGLQCLKDLRMFRRYQLVEVFATSGLRPTTKREIADNWQAVQSAICRQYADDPDIFPSVHNENPL